MGFIMNITMSDNDAVLLEDIDHKLSAVLEGQDAMAHLPGAVTKLQEDMTEVKADIKTVIAVVTDHSRQLTNHEVRITGLERA
jgi:hypothetical protein